MQADRGARNLGLIVVAAVVGIAAGSFIGRRLKAYRKSRSLQGCEGLVAFEEQLGESTDVPENAPHGCPGIQSTDAGQNAACAGCPNRTLCATGQPGMNQTHVSEIASKMASIKHKILVLSGKGGVGKSTVACQVAWELQSRGHSVGLLDIDICGPSVPRMTGTHGHEVRSFGEGWLPVCVNENFCVMSTGYLLPSDDGAVIWRGPKKNGLIRQFLSDVYWGDLDYLVVDTPPGTSDEHLSIVTLLGAAGVDGAIVVTTPQEVSLQDVRKEINFCKQTQIKVLGVVENMAGSVFASLDPEAAKKTCTKMEVPYAGSIELNPALLAAGENGTQIKGDTPVAKQLKTALDACLQNITSRSSC